MCAAYFVPPGDAGAVAPEFSPGSLCDASGRLLCVPEQILGVSLDEAGPDFNRSVQRAVRRLQMHHHPDRPSGSHFLSRLINISAVWLTDHREAYQSWAISEEGSAKLARASLAGPAPLRSPLTPAEEQRVLAELDNSAVRQECLRSQNQELASNVEQLQRAAADALEEAVAQRREAAATQHALRRRLAASESRRRQERRAAHARAADLRRRLASLRLCRRREVAALCAVAGASQAAELAAVEAVTRLQSRPSLARHPVLLAYLQRMTVHGDCSDRRTARRLLEMHR